MRLPPGARAVPDPQSLHRLSAPHPIQPSAFYLLTCCRDWLPELAPESEVVPRLLRLWHQTCGILARAHAP